MVEAQLTKVNDLEKRPRLRGAFVGWSRLRVLIKQIPPGQVSSARFASRDSRSGCVYMSLAEHCKVKIKTKNKVNFKIKVSRTGVSDPHSPFSGPSPALERAFRT